MIANPNQQRCPLELKCVQVGPQSAAKGCIVNLYSPISANFQLCISCIQDKFCPGRITIS